VSASNSGRQRAFAGNVMLLVVTPVVCGHNPVMTEERAGLQTG
jgi:hypothetical protein